MNIPFLSIHNIAPLGLPPRWQCLLYHKAYYPWSTQRIYLIFIKSSRIL